MEAFAGHLLVVGGRAVRIPPPGALAETAPKRAPRVREGDAFFVLITPTEETHAPSAFFEELARLAADTYFGSGGGITGGLREALAVVNGRLMAQAAHESGRKVNALALVLRGDELYAARSGKAFGVLRQGDDLTVFPADRADPLVMNLPPLGTGDTPEVQLARYTVAPDHVMLLADYHLSGASDDALREVLNGEGVPGVIERLKDIAGAEAAASVIQFVLPGAPDPGGLSVQASAHEAGPAPMRPFARASRPASKPPIPRVSSSAPPARPADFAVSRPAPGVSTPEAAPESTPEASSDPASDQPMSDPIRDVFSKLAGVVRRPATAGDSPSVIARVQSTARRWGRDALRSILAALLAVTNFLTRVLDQILPKPDGKGRQGIPTNIAVSLAILIPVVIVVVVVGLALSEAGKTEFEVYLDRAKSAHEEALSLSGGACDNPALRLTWVEVLRLAEQAEKYRPNDASVLVIKADAQNYLDCFDNVQRRDLTLLREFPAGVDLTGPVVGGGGVDLYTLDRANSVIYHDTVDTSTGDRLTTRDSDPIIRRNQAIGAFVVGDLFDIEWLVSGGTPYDNVLIALDRSGVLVSYSPTFFASAQQLVIEGRWQNPVAIAIFRGNLYVLDTGANQVWRYTPPSGERLYNNAPEEYFNDNWLPDLSHAVDFGISDNEGAIYILFDDGEIHKYRRNVQGVVEEQPFNYQQRPAGAISSGRALFVDNDPASRQLYIVDAADETIYETLLGGKFQHGYRPHNMTDAFRNLSGFYADSVVRNNMYVVAGNRLYHFARNQ